MYFYLGTNRFDSLPAAIKKSIKYLKEHKLFALEIYRFKKPSSVPSTRSYDPAWRSTSETSQNFSAWSLNGTRYGYQNATTSDPIFSENTNQRNLDYFFDSIQFQSGNSENIL